MNQIAVDIVRSCTSGKLSPEKRQKNPAVVVLEWLEWRKKPRRRTYSEEADREG